MLLVKDWRELQMRRNDRAMLIGATESGKTTLARYLIEDPNKKHSVVYDAKISTAIDEWLYLPHAPYYNFEQLQEAEESRLIYRPNYRESLDPYAQDAFFEWVYESRFTRVYVDEAYALLGGSSPSFHLQACLSRGRERGISTVVATQRPKRIPLITMSEAENFYIFRLNLIEDRMRVYELTGIDPIEQMELKRFEFFYYNAVWGQRSGRLRLNLAAPRQVALSRSDNNGRRGTAAATAFSVQHEAA